MSALRLLVTAINALAAIVVVIVGAVAWIVGSERGSARVVAYAAARLPGRVQFEHVDGTLSGGLTLHGIALEAGDGLVTVERATVDWSASSLLARAAVLDEVDLTGVAYTGGGGGGAGRVQGGAGGVQGGDRDGAADPGEAPFPIVARRASVDALTIESGGETLALGPLRFTGRWVGRRLVVEDVRSERPGVSLTGRAEFLFADAVALSADVSWAGDVGGRRAAGFLRATGTLPALELSHELIVPLALAATANAAIVRGARDARVEIADVAVDTGRGTLTGRGRVSLPTTEWHLTLEAGDAGPAAAWPEGTGNGGTRRRFEGRLLPELRWSAAATAAPGGR